MKITSSNTSYNSNFKAIKVARTTNKLGKTITNIDIYKITKEDFSFLENLKNKIKFKDFFQSLDEYSLERWQHIFEYCIRGALETPLHDSCTYVAICQNKPCGIINYHDFETNLYLNGICSIPIEKNKKVPLCGQTLFLQFFKDAFNKKIKNASLSAVNNGPFNVVDKYEKLGFVKDPTSYPYTKMVCNKYKIEESLKNLSKTINYKTSNQEKVNLQQFID